MSDVIQPRLLPLLVAAVSLKAVTTALVATASIISQNRFHVNQPALERPNSKHSSQCYYLEQRFQEDIIYCCLTDDLRHLLILLNLTTLVLVNRSVLATTLQHHAQRLHPS